MDSTGLISICVNGNPHDVPSGTTVSSLLALLNLNPRFLAIERNRELVPRTRHHESVLQSGDQLEIVTLVGGG